MLSTFIWDPNRNFFVVPYVEHPITWYGIFFAFGFIVSYFLVRRVFFDLLAGSLNTFAETKLTAITLTDRLTFLVVIGTILGARLGHVFFYGWPYYQQHPIEMLKVWKGGLASHGGAIGILITLLIFWAWHRKLYPRFSFLTILDATVLPAAFVGGCIRIGNFINQEITGTPTTLPWGVVFLHPQEGYSGVAVHPVQLYESLFYFVVFAFLFFFWKANKQVLGKGLLTGFFFLCVFGFRFIIEFLKMPQSELIAPNAFLSMGQWLSIPFFLVGIGMLVYYFCSHKRS